MAVTPTTRNSSTEPEPKIVSPSWAVTVFCTYPSGPERICVRGFSTNCNPVSRASQTMPTSMVTATRPSISSVVAALRLFGALNAGTPLEIASTPVSAAQPEEKLRSSRNAMAQPVVSCHSAAITRSALGARRSSPSTTIRTSPVRIMPMTTIMKPYVGMANAMPESCRPRRLTAVSRATATTAMSTLWSATKGTTEPRFATPEETDTATVST